MKSRFARRTEFPDLLQKWVLESLSQPPARLPARSRGKVHVRKAGGRCIATICCRGTVARGFGHTCDEAASRCRLLGRTISNPTGEYNQC